MFFVDSAHFVWAAFVGFLWCFSRVWVKAPCGRQRYNVLGALNAITHQLITITNTSYINSETVCELLYKLAELQLSIPITLIMDNARYQRCRLVEDCAKSLNIELLFLPTYSPNLNLIERMWKFVKNECLYAKYYTCFKDFTSAIDQCLSQTRSTHKHKLATLLTLNFQIFNKREIMTA